MPSTPSLIACVHIPHFTLRVAMIRRPELDGIPLVLTTADHGRSIVADCTPEAASHGIRSGMAVRETVALCPEAIVLSPNPLRDASALNEIATALEAISPLVEPDSEHPGCCYVDLRGLARRLGPPEAAAGHLLKAVPPILRPRIGIASGKFVARVAAGQAPPGGYRIVPADQVTTFLANQPINWLPLPPTMLRRFERIDLRVLGQLAALPGAAVAARFGPTGRQAWRLARGQDDDLVCPPIQETRIVEELEMPAPATSRDSLLIALSELALRAFSRPALRARQVRQARLRARLEGDGSWEQVATLREPGGHRRVVEALGFRLHAVTSPGPVEALRLEVIGIIDEPGRQETLPGLRSRRPRQLAEASQQLTQRFGSSGLYRIVEVEPWSRIPERRHALMSYDPSIDLAR